MKITPLEIRQKTFEKKIRGFDKDEVNAFLLSLSQEWEHIIDANKEFKIKLEASEREVGKLREVESSLFKTLKTAEDTGANLIEQATKTAELHMRETQITADTILNESKAKSKSLMEEAESRSRKSIEDMERRVQEIYQVYREIEKHKDSLISDLKHMANDSLERIQKLDGKIKSFDLEEHMKKISKELKASETPLPGTKVSKSSPTKENVNDTEMQAQKQGEKEGSFFDEIE